MVLYNGQSQSTSQIVRLQVKTPVAIQQTNNSILRLPSRKVFSFKNDGEAVAEAAGDDGGKQTNFEAVFLARDIPPFGYKVFNILHHQEQDKVTTFKSRYSIQQTLLHSFLRMALKFDN